ncbi:hypothetical protein YC2023_025690 [Brassica napus]
MDIGTILVRLSDDLRLRRGKLLYNAERKVYYNGFEVGQATSNITHQSAECRRPTFTTSNRLQYVAYNTILASTPVLLHAQALTLAGLAGAAAVEYYDHKTGATDRYPKFLKPDNLNKD